MHLSTFIHQKSYEHVEYQIRRHPITLLPAVIGFIFLLILPAGLAALIGASSPNFLNHPVWFPLAVLFSSGYYLAIGLFFYTYFVTFYLDLLVLTNDRLLHIEQLSLFSRTISELDLYKVQDITSKISGFFQSLFKYGTLEIQTAGEQGKFIFQDLPHPESLRQRILELTEGDKKYHPNV